MSGDGQLLWGVGWGPLPAHAVGRGVAAGCWALQSSRPGRPVGSHSTMAVGSHSATSATQHHGCWLTQRHVCHTAPWLLAHTPPWPPPCNPVLAGVEHESQVDRTLSPHVKANLLSVRDWRGYRNPWMPEGGAHAGVDGSRQALLVAGIAWQRPGCQMPTAVIWRS